MKTITFIFFVSLCIHGQDTNHKINLITYGGLPKTDKVIKKLYHEAFISGYSEKMKQPLWTCYRLGNNKKELTVQIWERPPLFFIDRRIEDPVHHDAYSESGYQRGHLAPNSAIQQNYGQMAQLETFLMSNISPQKKELNQGIWEELEEKVREDVSRNDTGGKVKNLYVITGPIFSNNPKILKNGNDYVKFRKQIPIPTHFYKIIVYAHGYRAPKKATAFIFPQIPTSQNLDNYLTTVDQIEEKTGLNFFNELEEEEEEKLESKKLNLEQKEVD